MIALTDKKAYNEIENVKDDLKLLKLSFISLDIRVNDGYDFHDFDVVYDKVADVIDFYMKFYK